MQNRPIDCHHDGRSIFEIDNLFQHDDFDMEMISAVQRSNKSSIHEGKYKNK